MATMAELAQRATAAGRIGIDTEFMGEGRYRPQLFLVQVATPRTERRRGGRRRRCSTRSSRASTRSPLAAVLADPAVEIVLHAGRQDVALLRRVWDTELHNIFDTQVAAGFAGPARPARLRGAAARDPRRAPAEVGELHTLGRSGR